MAWSGRDRVFEFEEEDGDRTPAHKSLTQSVIQSFQIKQGKKKNNSTIIETLHHLQTTREPTPKCRSLTRDLGVETAETYGERLEGRDRISIIHGENIFPNLPKLQNHPIMLWARKPVLGRCNKLEILDRGHRNPSMEIQAPTLELLVPPRGLVSQHK
ncbi:aldolase-type TIM barrel family protein [Striga asiatica]|uniref:Aldolase-type TIM barrel family protein n=1 Tax=Striga asiatica TaxID=4170 RepID=A0A5A7PCF4_STRAF|nr:aldolase-type TIM barrel family protein [Striga asiatica]